MAKLTKDYELRLHLLEQNSKENEGVRRKLAPDKKKEILIC